MVATPIPLHIIHTVFQYILPPCLPLPPHLLSRALIERHHYLSPPIDDPTLYLCWPSSNNEEVAEALERSSQDTLTSEPEHDLRYSVPDQETLLAHVRPDTHSPLQIVFIWDIETGSWRYHDARLLPFPEASFPSLDVALAKADSNVEWPSIFVEQPSHESHSPSPASDSYWAGYESSGSSRNTSAASRAVNVFAEEDEKVEAAYWASYSAVQGSGDSTIPSPRLEKRRIAQSRKPPEARETDATLDPFVANLHLRLQKENGLLSPRFSCPERSESAGDGDPTVMDEQPQQTRSTYSRSSQAEDENYEFPKLSDLQLIGSSASEMVCEIGINTPDTGTNNPAKEEDGVREAVRGIYRMWKRLSGSEDRDAFLDVVQILCRVSELVDIRPEAFLNGDEETRTTTLEAAKCVFDLSLQLEQRARAPVAQLLRSVEPSTRPQTRSQTRAAKRNRSPSPPSRSDEEIWRPTPLESLHIEGMNDDQVWAQLELRTAALCDVLKIVLEEEVNEDEEDEDEEDENRHGALRGLDEEDLEGLEDLDSMDEEEESEEDGDDDDNEEGMGEDIAELHDPSEESDQDQMDLDRPTRPYRQGNGKVLPGKQRGGHPVLDDGFFSLADFNAETEEAEAKDVSKGHLRQNDDDEDNDVADDDVDLFAAVDDVGGETFEEDDLEDGGEPHYKDFFAPPPRKVSTTSKTVTVTNTLLDTQDKKGKVRFHEEVRVKKIRSRGKRKSVASMNEMIWEEDDDDDESGNEGAELGELDEDMEEDDHKVLREPEDEGEDEGGTGRETIERLKDDLFGEDEEAPSKDVSTHEARQIEIASQIAELESKNIGPKEWTLMGEATSRSRPVNSLLEEDLEFDRVMKAIPVVTEERVNSLEELIKKRILDNRFNDVVRKRPVDDKPFLPSRFFELNDQKSAQSLAQIYEDEYSAAASGTGVDDRDGKLKKEHEELTKMWDNICHKLDALSNAHFTPKQPKATISTISNVAATTLESALPTTKSTTGMLAPEEIFAAPSDIRSRDELTPIEKRAHRNKQRKARKKAKDQLAANVDKFSRTQKVKGSAGAVKREKDKALKSVVKTGKGVTVVGKQTAGLKSRRKAKESADLPMDGKRLKL